MLRLRTVREPFRRLAGSVGGRSRGWRFSTTIAFAFLLVGTMFFTSLRGGGSLVSADIVETAAPFNDDRPVGFSAQNGPGDPINIHSHWSLVSESVRSGDFSWWTTSLSGGYPVIKGGLPVFDLAYLVVPAWYAPGLVAALRTLTAMLLTVGFLRSLGVHRAAAALGGAAFALSGFMVGWMNWPQSSVAALAPGLLWAIERLIASPKVWRAVPLAFTVAAMGWSNFPQVTIFVLLGAAVYAAIRMVEEVRIGTDSGESASSVIVGRALTLGLSTVLALGMLFPYLVSFNEYLAWADTSQRGFSSNTAAGGRFLLTSVAPATFGSDPTGVRWWEFGNWVELQVYAGASVVLLVSFAFLRRGSDESPLGRRRRAATWAMLLIGSTGATIAYIGGPVGDLVYWLLGSQMGLATRAKVLLSLALAIGAGVGADAWLRERDPNESDDFRTGIRWIPIVMLIVGLAFVPSIRDWYQEVQSRGIARQTLRAALWPAAAVILVGVGLWLRFRDRLSRDGLQWLLVAVVAVELLQFSVQVPTVVDRDDRLQATQAHQQVQDLLGPGERLAGEGNTFFANTGQLFGIDDVRGQLLKSPGYQALMRSVDVRMFENEFGGTPTYPNIQIGTDPTSPVWDAFAVGVWSQFPSSLPPGPILEAPTSVEFADPAERVLTGEFIVPQHGLRAVELEVDIAALAEGRVAVTVEVEGVVLSTTRRRDELLEGEAVFVLTGDDLPAGAVATLTVAATGPTEHMLVGLDGSGDVSATLIGGAADGLRVVRSGDVTLIELDAPGFVRLFDAAVHEPGLGAGVQLVAHRSQPGPAITAVDVGLPQTPNPDAQLHVESVYVHGGTSRAVVDVDRPALVVFSNNSYPGWQAKVDGVDSPVITVDTNFTGVLVASGRHEVVLSFRPTHLIRNILVAGLSVTVSLGILIWVRLRGVSRGTDHIIEYRYRGTQ